MTTVDSLATTFSAAPREDSDLVGLDGVKKVSASAQELPPTISVVEDNDVVVGETASMEDIKVDGAPIPGTDGDADGNVGMKSRDGSGEEEESDESSDEDGGMLSVIG